MSTIKVKNIQHPSAAEPAIVLNPDGSINVDINDLGASSLNGGGFGFRNKLINGSFDIWQRGSNFAAAGYTADRWRGDANIAYTRVFGPDGLTYGMSLSAGTASIQQCIELGLTGRAGEFYTGTTWTLSWYSTTDTITPNVMFRDSSAPVSNDVSITVGSVSAVETVGSWTRYKAVVTIDQSPAATNECLSVILITSGATSISGIQLEKGGLTAFEQRFKGFELSLCQRYYFLRNSTIYINRGYGEEGYLSWNWPTTMRKVPTVTVGNTSVIYAVSLSADIWGIKGYIKSDFSGTPAITTIEASAEF